jgi:hypothetical protein
MVPVGGVPLARTTCRLRDGGLRRREWIFSEGTGRCHSSTTTSHQRRASGAGVVTVVLSAGFADVAFALHDAAGKVVLGFYALCCLVVAICPFIAGWFTRPADVLPRTRSEPGTSADRHEVFDRSSRQRRRLRRLTRREAAVLGADHLIFSRRNDLDARICRWSITTNGDEDRKT